jgi:two-component system, OmpR family, sensor histidine kinase MprB
VTLRRRFTIVVAAAVAAVTLAITAVAFIVIRTDLENQLRQQLAGRAASVVQEARHYHGHIPQGWVPPHSDRFGAAALYTQVVTADGAVWASAGDLGLLAPGPAAVSVAAGRQVSYYTHVTLDGVRALVLTTPLAPGLAVQLAVPLNTVDKEVTRVGTTLALLSAVGVALAALVGWGVARAGLAPVGRLAAVAEQVTATGNPGGRVEVERHDELGRLATSFNAMLSELQRSLAAQRQLVSDASHELRTPLTSMRINVELLASDADLSAEERQELLERVVAQGAELGQLVASITELARGDAPDNAGARVTLREVALHEVALHEVVGADLELARRDWPQTVFQAELEPCFTFGNAERIRSAIRNLLDNAAKFSPPGAQVDVRLADGELTVRDRGPGIAPADLPHVFDRFYRASSARGIPGSGLGLSIVRQVAESHGGTIRAEAMAGGGTVMCLRLPGLTPIPVSQSTGEELSPAGTPRARKIPATLPAIHSLPAAVGCRPPAARRNRHPPASGSMMITLWSAAVPAVTIAWSVWRADCTAERMAW